MNDFKTANFKPGDIVCANQKLFSVKMGDIAVVIRTSTVPDRHIGSYGFDGFATDYVCHLEVMLLSKIQATDVWENQWRKIEHAS